MHIDSVENNKFGAALAIVSVDTGQLVSLVPCSAAR